MEMEENLKEMADWERKKAVYLLNVAETLGIDTSGYGKLAVNDSSGYTYLWLEDYLFTLYMPVSCELKKEDVYVQWYDFEDGEEYETPLNNMSLDDVYDWVDETEKKARSD